MGLTEDRKIKFNNQHITLFFFIIFFLILIYQIGKIPAGLFCDEAQIGNIAYQLSKGNISGYFVPPLFYQHFNTVIGYLPIIATAPFVLLGNLSELTVRLSSVIYSLLGLFIVYLTLRELNINIIFPLLLLAFSPLFFHISRINFGHTPSFMFVSLGLLFYFKFKKKKLLHYLIISAVALGVSSYGYAGYIPGTPLLVISLILAEIFFNRLNIKKYKATILMTAIFLITYSPILLQLRFNPLFTQRLRDKNSGEVLNLQEKLPHIVKNYLKYYSYDYLFAKGETDSPGAFITRHSVKGNGIYLRSLLPLLIIGLVYLIIFKDKQKKDFLPFFIFFFLVPLPDLLTTKDNIPPYSFSLFYGQLSIPFISAYALKIFNHLPRKLLAIRIDKIFSVFFFCILAFDIFFFLRNYYRYPLYSADYWGWQYGPKTIVEYFLTQQHNYDELYMTGYFNEPISLLSFYNFDKRCSNCLVGHPTNDFNYNKRQLFAVRTEELNTVKINYSVKKLIRLLNQQIAYYIIEPNK